MIPFFKELFRDFFFSAEKFRLWVRSVLGFVTLVLVQVFAYPWEVVKEWSMEEIGYRLAVAALGAFALGIGVGEKNPKALPTPPKP